MSTTRYVSWSLHNKVGKVSILVKKKFVILHILLFLLYFLSFSGVSDISMYNTLHPNQVKP